MTTSSNPDFGLLCKNIEQILAVLLTALTTGDSSSLNDAVAEWQTHHVALSKRLAACDRNLNEKIKSIRRNLSPSAIDPKQKGDLELKLEIREAQHAYNRDNGRNYLLAAFPLWTLLWALQSTGKISCPCIDTPNLDTSSFQAPFKPDCFEIPADSAIDKAGIPRFSLHQMAEFLVKMDAFEDSSGSSSNTSARRNLALGILEKLSVPQKEAVTLIDGISNIISYSQTHWIQSELSPWSEELKLYSKYTEAALTRLKTNKELLYTYQAGNNSKVWIPRFQFLKDSTRKKAVRRLSRALYDRSQEINDSGEINALSLLWLNERLSPAHPDMELIKNDLEQMRLIKPRSRKKLLDTVTLTNKRPDIAWRVSHQNYHPRWFANREGRFDLNCKDDKSLCTDSSHGAIGTMYLADNLLGCISEVFDYFPVITLKTATERVASQAKLHTTNSYTLADLTTLSVTDVKGMDRSVTQEKADRLHATGHLGIYYQLRTNPEEYGYAIFGENPSTHDPSKAGHEWYFKIKCTCPNINTPCTCAEEPECADASCIDCAKLEYKTPILGRDKFWEYIEKDRPAKLKLTYFCRFPGDVTFADEDVTSADE